MFSKMNRYYCILAGIQYLLVLLSYNKYACYKLIKLMYSVLLNRTIGTNL